MRDLRLNHSRKTGVFIRIFER